MAPRIGTTKDHNTTRALADNKDVLTVANYWLAQGTLASSTTFPVHKQITTMNTVTTFWDNVKFKKLPSICMAVPTLKSDIVFNLKLHWMLCLSQSSDGLGERVAGDISAVDTHETIANLNCSFPAEHTQ